MNKSLHVKYTLL